MSAKFIPFFNSRMESTFYLNPRYIKYIEDCGDKGIKACVNGEEEEHYTSDMTYKEYLELLND